VCRALEADGHQVVRGTSSAGAGARDGYVQWDFLEPARFEGVVSGFDTVVNSANFPNYPIENRRRGHTFDNFDRRGVIALAEACANAKVSRLVHVAGVGANRGPALTPYFDAIRAGEDAILAADLDSAVVRPALVYGRGDRGLNLLLAIARRTRVAPINGPGRWLHGPVHIDDVAEVVKRLVTSHRQQGGIFEAGVDEVLPAIDLFRMVLDIAEVRAKIVHLPLGGLHAFAGVAQRTPWPLLTRAAVDFSTEDFVGDPTRIGSELDYRLVELEVGLKQAYGPGAPIQKVEWR